MLAISIAYISLRSAETDLSKRHPIVHDNAMNVSTKVWLILSLSSLTLIFLGYSLLGRVGSLIGFIFSILFLTGFFLAYRLGSLNQYAKIRLSASDCFHLFYYFKEASQMMQMQCPEIYIIKSADCWTMIAPQPFNTSHLYISEGLAESLSENEKMAFAALTLSTYQNQNHTFTIITHLLARVIFKFGRALDQINPIRFIVAKNITFLSPIFSGLAKLVLMLTFQKRKFDFIDDDAVRILESPHELAKLLVKMSSWMQSRPLDFDPSLYNLFIISPNEKNNFFDFHSELKLRVQRLIGYYPV